MNPLHHVISWYDLQTLDVWEWSQEEHDDIGGIISAGINFPPSPPMIGWTHERYQRDLYESVTIQMHATAKKLLKERARHTRHQ